MRRYLVWTVVVFVAFYAGCVKKPLVEIERAKQAVEEARKAEAPKYAPDEFQSAENFLEKAIKEMESGEYPAARASAISAENLAKQALEKALKAKEAESKAGETGEPSLPPAGTITAPVVTFSQDDVIGKGSGGEGIVLRQLKNVYFAFDDYSLSPEARETVKQNAEWLKPFLENNSDYDLVIEGHCDERGTEEYNLALGQRRADSVKKYLVILGIPEDRIKTISYGESVPADPRHNEEAWAKNRRAVFVLKKR